MPPTQTAIRASHWSADRVDAASSRQQKRRSWNDSVSTTRTRRLMPSKRSPVARNSSFAPSGIGSRIDDATSWSGPLLNRGNNVRWNMMWTPMKDQSKSLPTRSRRGWNVCSGRTRSMTSTNAKGLPLRSVWRRNVFISGVCGWTCRTWD